MASASIVQITPSNAGVYHVPNLDERASIYATKFLQENHDNFHIFFNDRGFHNHIAHYMLTAFTIGASPLQLQRAFEQEKKLQRPQFPVNDKIVMNLSDEKLFRSHLSQEEYFHDYVVFFEREIQRKGWQAVLREHLFSQTENAEQLLTRMFASFLHPLIHLGFGIEFDQPAIVAEALAMAAVHQNDVGPILIAAEAASKDQKPKPMIELLREVRENEKIRTASCWGDGFSISDSDFLEAPQDLPQITGQWRVLPSELEERTAEMINVNAFFTGAAQAPPKAQKLDFIFIHSMNCSIFFTAILKQDWLDIDTKIRLLEWKGRFDMFEYAARGSPQLRLEEIVNYKSKRPGSGWETIFAAANAFDDDSHVSKLVRALANGSKVCEPYEVSHRDTFPVKSEMWLQIARMAIDTTEDVPYQQRWVRGAGFPRAWENVKDRTNDLS